MRLFSILIEAVKTLLRMLVMIPLTIAGGGVLTGIMVIAMLISLFEDFNRNIK